MTGDAISSLGMSIDSQSNLGRANPIPLAVGKNLKNGQQT